MEIAADWTPTAENIEALPDPLRRYLHAMHQAGADPAGLLRENYIMRQQIDTLQRDLAALRAELAAARAC